VGCTDSLWSRGDVEREGRRVAFMGIQRCSWFESQPPDVNESEADQQGRPGVSASVWTLGHFSMARGSVY